MQGTIKKLIHDRGFGFIKSQDGSEVFFHRSSLRGLSFESLAEGVQVEFDVQQAEKGPRAVAVRAQAQA